MIKHTLKILWCEDRKIFKVCLTILQHYGIKGYVFYYEQWSLSFWGSHDTRKFAIKIILDLAQLYFKHESIIQDEQKLARKHWPLLFWGKKIKSRQTPIIGVCKEFVCCKCGDIGGGAVLLLIMMAISSNTTNYEHGFSCMNREESVLRTRLGADTLDHTMCINIDGSFLNNRGGSRTAVTSKMGHFVIIVNGWKPLTIITKWPILDVAAVLDPPLEFWHWEICLWLDWICRYFQILKGHNSSIVKHMRKLMKMLLLYKGKTK